jgi:amino acid adenylation domain-containing protein
VWPPTALQAAMIQSWRNGDAPWVDLEQIVIRDPDAAPGVHVLARALDTLARRHMALRLVAAEGADGAPAWHLRTRPVVALATHDWSALAPAAQERALAEALSADRAAGLDLAAAPGWRAMLADCGAQGHVVVLTVHHALLDAPSMAVVVEELYDLIAGRALDNARPSDPVEALAALAGLPPDAEDRARALMGGFDAPALLSIPPEATQTGRMRVLRQTLDPATSAAFRARAGTPPTGPGGFAMIQAVWAIVLARWTGANDLAFGLTLAGRNRLHGHDRTVGCLIATLPQRVQLADLPDLDTLAARLRAQTRDLRALHSASADRLRGWAGLAPGLALFDTLLVFSRATLGATLAARGKGWERRQVRLIEEGDTPLTLAIYDDPAMVIEIEHDPSRISPSRAARLLDHVATLIAAVAASPQGVALGDLPMLTPPEARRLERLAQPDQPSRRPVPCIADELARLAAERPRARALCAPSGAQGPDLTRALLERRANALARALAAQAAPGARVAVWLPRGPDWVVALVACLKARLVFAPFDPAQPAELSAEVARAADCAVLVARTALPGLALPRLDPDQGQSAEAPALPPAAPDSCAYLIHTSGTTGRPKGVMGGMGALAAHAAAVIDAFRLTEGDRVLAVAAPAFDVALEEVVPSLLAGASVITAPPEALASVPALLDLIAAERASVLNLPASLWHLLADEMDRRRLRLPASVRLVVTGSERVAPQALAVWRRIAPDVAWMNAYGPTEATITALVHRLDPADPAPDPAEPVPVGRPLAHARARILAQDGTPAPEGAPGELVLGGPAVALGYLDRPAETARAFVPDRHATGADTGARAYRTGDRARLRCDGRIEFLGRGDRQVKLRGHRIDLGGVEQVLAGLPGVRSVHVAPDPEGVARLVAWFAGPAVAEGPEGLARLRAGAARRLPSYALPVLVPVAELPLRANGKIDPARLPRPMPDAATDPRASTAGQEIGPVAEVAALIAEVLGLDSIDPDLDFRDQGGHSLAALRLAGAIETRFGRRTRTTDLYRHPTARELAAHLAAPPADGPRWLVPIQPRGTGVPFYAVHVLGAKEGLWRPLAQALGPDRPVWGLTMGPPRDPDAVSIRAVARAYFEDLQRHQPEGPIALGAVSMAAYFAYDLAQLLRAAGRDVRLLAVFDAEGPGGRPSLQGAAKLAAHGRELRRRGLAHLRAVMRTRLEKVRFARDLALAGPDRVNGAALVWANVRAVEAYRPEPYLGRIAVFRAADSFWDSPEAIASALGWEPVARGGMSLHDIPGDHLTILEPGNVAHVAAHLRRLLPPD